MTASADFEPLFDFLRDILDGEELAAVQTILANITDTTGDPAATGAMDSYL